jgi:hypothetical protein
MFQSFGVANGRLVKQVLKFPTIVERPLNIGHEFIRDIDRESPPLHSDVQDMAGVLFPLQAGLAAITDAGAPAKAERAQSGRPKIYGLIPEPLFHVCGRFFWSSHDVYVPHSTRTVKRILSNAVIAVVYEFRDRN